MKYGYYKGKFYEKQSSTYLSFINNYVNENYKEFNNSSYIPIEIFRDLYLNHKDVFPKLVKELVLRGGIFHLEKPSYIFPSINIENEEYIHTTPEIDKDAYKKLDFSILNLSNFTSFFNIEDNSFYNYIPIEGFKIFGLGKNDIKILKKEFEDKNFKIIKNEDKDIIYKNNKSSNYPIINLYNKNEVFRQSLKGLDNNYKYIYSLINNNIFYFISISDLGNSIIADHLNGPIKLLETDKAYELLKSLNKEEIELIIYNIKSILQDREFLSRTIAKIIKDNPESKHISIDHKLRGFGIDLLARIIKEKNIETVGQLSEDILSEIFSSKGIGNVKVRKFTDVILGIIIFYFNSGEKSLIINDPDKSSNKIVNELKFDINTHFKPYYSKIDLKNTDLFYKDDEVKVDIGLFKNIQERLKVLKNSGFSLMELVGNVKIFNKYLINETFKNIYNFSVKEILNEENNHSFIYELIFWLDNIIFIFSENYNNLEYIFKDYEFKDIEEYILVTRILAERPLTLKEIGDKFDITRERVRQIEKQVKNEIANGDFPIYFKIYVNFIMGNNKAIELKEGLDLYFEIISLKDFYYDKKSNLLVREEFVDIYERIKLEFNRLINDKKIISKESLNKYIEIECEENNLDQSDVENILFAYINQHFYHNNMIVSINNIYIADKLLFILKNYYPNNILDLTIESNLLEFENLYKSLYDEKFFSGKKSKQSQIEDKFTKLSEKVIKLGTSKFKLIDIDDFPYDLLEKIESYINEELLTYGNVSVKKIYWKFEEDIIKSGYNEESIYYVIKLFYSDDYYFEGRTKKRIYPKGEEAISTTEILKNLLIMNNGEMKIEDAAKDMGVEEYSINNNLDTSLFYIEDGSVRIIGQEKINVETINFIKSLVEKEKNNNGYVSIKRIYEKILFDIDKQKDLIENDCKNLGEFTNLIKTIYPDINSNKLIIMEDAEYSDYINIFIKELGERKKYTRKDFYEVGTHFGFSSPSIHSYIKNSLDTGNIVELDENYMIKADKLEVTQENIDDIDIFLDEFYDKKEGYISLYHQLNKMYLINDIDGHIPSPQIVSFVACKYLSYRKLETSVMKYDSDPLILTLDNKISYEDILYKKMNDFIGVKTEENILKYLKEQGLISPNTNRIYKSFYNKKLFKLNEFYRIELGKFYE
ncbi:sigma factor-like helix-turn-helix DNA-binding protein [uncultured Anaerococcus sp.]|uniref:sigma factor-like helix-turn-helix DNA-binding protein n=1 Tax=uncultured Anaerococcus sp. TaxID=293428 RepID=UPI002621B5A7|nr:sigma factor-like helix-turn-helix DNA-binding protein [uncultured Anaerococcus sp.]